MAVSVATRVRFTALVVVLWTTDVLVKRAVAVVLLNSCRRITSGLIFARGVTRDAPGVPGVPGDTCADVVGKVTRVAGVVGEADVTVVRSLVVAGMSGVDVRVWVRV